MKKLKLQIKSIYGSVLFEYESENNTIAKTVQAAVENSADLSSANLRYANLSSANLRSADLSYADLRSADLRYADLSSANLSYADLRSADLRYADLRYADLRSADLRYAKNSKLAVAMTRILPEGTIIGWKKCKDNIIVKLEIPAKAKRSHAFGRECRAEYVKVLQVYKAKEAVSSYTSDIVYRKGEIVKPTKPFDEDFTQECSSGIHFYITREEAENHVN